MGEHSAASETPNGAVGTSGGKVIAVDMDDVLCQTNAAIVELHNKMYKLEPPLTLDDFKHYLYWDNRGWGSKQETARMVTELVDAGLYMRSPPVPGAKENLLKLKAMGYKLVIITARGEKQREVSEEWLALHMPDIFDEIHFTGAFAHLSPTPAESQGHAASATVVSHVKRTKFSVCHALGAVILIDDSAENVLSCAGASPPVPCLLFGDYAWNAAIRKAGVERHADDKEVEEGGMTYREKESRGGGLIEEAEARRQEVIREGWLPAGVERVRDWEGVVEWVQKTLG